MVEEGRVRPSVCTVSVFRVREEAVLLAQREVCVFFPPRGASGWGRVRRSFGEAQRGAG